jgi:hypothetical protein
MAGRPASFSQKERARLFALVSYNSETGRLTWKVPPSNTNIKPGDEVGSLSGGRRRLRVGGRSFLCHRIAWLLHFGDEPSGFIDHINGDPLDNRIANLRLATSAQNAMNKGEYQKRSGLPKGVTLHPASGKFRARIRRDGSLRSLGLFLSADEAGQVYRLAATELFGEFARGAPNASP